MFEVDPEYHSEMHEGDFDTHADADVEEDEAIGGLGVTEGAKSGHRGLRPRVYSHDTLYARSDGEADEETGNQPSRPPVQRRHRASASKRSTQGGGGGGAIVRRSSALDTLMVRQALERTLACKEWDDSLLLLGTKELNNCLKQADYSKDQIAALKVARRRAKNRTYALRSRQKKSGKSLAPKPGISSSLANGGSSGVHSPSVKIEFDAEGSGRVESPHFRHHGEEGGELDSPTPVEDMDADGAFEIGQLGHDLCLSLDEDDQSVSSEHWDTASSYSGDFSLDGGFTSSTSYDSSMDMLSSSLDSHCNPSARAAACDALGSLSLDGVPDYPAVASDNFLRMVFANIPEDAKTNAAGSAAAPTTSLPVTTADPEMGPGDPGTELGTLMSDFRSITSGYDEVHKKLDSILGLIPEAPRDRINTVVAGPPGLSGRTTPTPMFSSVKIEGWSSELGAPISRDEKSAQSAIFDQATPLSTDGGPFLFDVQKAHIKAAAHAARRKHTLSMAPTAMAITP